MLSQHSSEQKFNSMRQLSQQIVEQIEKTPYLITFKVNAEYMHNRDDIAIQLQKCICLPNDENYVLVYEELENQSSFTKFAKILEKLPKMYLTKLKTIYLIRGQCDNKMLLSKVRMLQDFSELKVTPINSFQSHDMNQMGIPLMMDSIMQYFRVGNHFTLEGVFRKAGDYDNIHKLYDQMYHNDYSTLFESEPHVVACVLKQYLMKLEHPLITSSKVYNPNLKIKDVLNDLSATNLRILYVFVGFLLEFVKQSEINKMTINNMAIIFAPVLVRMQQQSKTSLLDIGLSIKFIAKLLQQFDQIVPNFSYTLFLVENIPQQEGPQNKEEWSLQCEKRRKLRNLSESKITAS